MSRRANVDRHGQNHAYTGSDPIGPIDSTENSPRWGVHSVDPTLGNENAGLILAATGDGGSVWTANLPSGFETWAGCLLSNAALLAHWQLNEASGNAADSSGHGRTATAVPNDGYPVYGLAGPFTGITAIRFGGTAGFAGGRGKFSYSPDTTVNNAFDATNPWTVECFVYMDSHTSGTIFRAWNGGSNVGVEIGTDNSGHITAQRRGGTVITSTTVVPVTTWTHVRVTYSGTTLAIFINTIPDVTLADSGNMDGFGTILIGNGYLTTGTSSPFQGRLANVAIFDDDLTTFCGLLTEDGPISSGTSDAGQVPTSDGSGSSAWAFPTIAVDSPAGRFNQFNLGDAIVGTDEGDDSVTLDVATDGSTLEVSSDALRVKDGGVTEAKLGLSDNTTANVSTTKHGLVPKAPNDTGQFLRGDGTWATVTVDPADDTAVWMPLTTVVAGDPVLVWDGDDSLIPTLIPL